MTRAVLVLCVLALSACPGPCPKTLTLGTGASKFDPVVDGQDLTIQFGGQGGRHVWGAARATGVPNSGTLSFRVSDGTDTTLASRQLELGLFTSTQGIECGWELAGQTVVFNGFNDPSMLVGSKVRLTVNFSSPDDALSAHADVVLR